MKRVAKRRTTNASRPGCASQSAGIRRSRSRLEASKSGSDDALDARLKALVHDDRRTTVEIVACLAECLGRKRHLEQGWGSVFAWCRDELGMSADAAYNRVAAARAVRHFPVILDHLAAGFVSLTAIKVLRPVLTSKNHLAVLAEAKHRSKKECERIVARLDPKPDVPSSIRKLPTPAPLATPVVVAPDAPALDPDNAGLLPGTAPVVQQPASPAVQQSAPPSVRPAVIAPLAPKRYRLEVTMDEETHDAIRRLQDLLVREVPGGDPAAIVKRAVLAYVADVEKKKRAAATRPQRPHETREGSRDIPAHVQREVGARDGERCARAVPERPSPDGALMMRVSPCFG